jgi:hypothetical protein
MLYPKSAKRTPIITCEAIYKTSFNSSPFWINNWASKANAENVV